MVDANASSRASARGWGATLAAVCVAQATAIAGFDFTLPFIPLYLQHDLGVHGLGATAVWAGLIGFGPSIPATIFGPIWGRLADRIGYRVMLLRAMLSASVLLSLMGFAPSPIVLLALRMVQGGLTGTVFSSQALVAASAPRTETARAMGLLQMSVYVGATFGPIAGGAVAGTLGYRAAFVGAGILLATATIVVVTFVTEPERQNVRPGNQPEQRVSMVELLVIPAFAAALLLTTIVQIAGTALLPVIPLYVQELLHTTRDVATPTGWLLALSGVTAALGSYGAGRLQRRFELKRLLVVAVVASAVLLVPQAFVHGYTDFLVLRAASALAFGALFGLVGTLAAFSSPPEAKGMAFGMVGAASSIGFGSGPLLGGALAAAIGIRPLFVLSAGLLALIPVMLVVAAALAPAAGPVRSALPRLQQRQPDR